MWELTGKSASCVTEVTCHLDLSCVYGSSTNHGALYPPTCGPTLLSLTRSMMVVGSELEIRFAWRGSTPRSWILPLLALVLNVSLAPRAGTSISTICQPHPPFPHSLCLITETTSQRLRTVTSSIPRSNTHSLSTASGSLSVMLSTTRLCLANVSSTKKFAIFALPV